MVDLTFEKLMTMTLAKYNFQVTKNLWGAKSDEEQQIVALVLTNVPRRKSAPDGTSVRHLRPRLWGISRVLVPRVRFQVIKETAMAPFTNRQTGRSSVTKRSRIIQNGLHLGINVYLGGAIYSS